MSRYLLGLVAIVIIGILIHHAIALRIAAMQQAEQTKVE